MPGTMSHGSLNGAAVRVSLVCFDRGDASLAATLDGVAVEEINADLTLGARLDLHARPLSRQNRSVPSWAIRRAGRSTCMAISRAHG